MPGKQQNNIPHYAVIIQIMENPTVNREYSKRVCD